MSTQDFLVELVHSNPDKTCILGSKSDQFSYSAFSQPSIEKKGYVGYTYGDLLSLVERFVAGISKHNKEHQNNFITTILPTSVDLFVSILGTFASGHSLAFLDPSRGVRSALTLMGQIHPKFYFSTTKGSLLNLFRSGTKNFTCYSKLALPRRTKFIELGNHGSDNKFHMNKPSDTAITTFSSGTHGELKQVVRDHRVLFNQHKAITQVLGFKNDDMEYSTLPLFLLNAITSGIPIVLPKLSSPDVDKLNSKVATEIYDTFEKLPVTIFITSPAFLRKLTDYKLDIGKERSHQLRKIFVGGAPVSFSLLKSASQVWQTEIVAAYGSTEAEPIATFSSSEMVSIDRVGKIPSPYCLGRTVEGVQVEISEFDKPFYSNGVQESGGEILVKGQNVVYTPEGSREVNGKKFMATGDVGLILEGNLWLMGNMSNLLEFDGNFVTPHQIEEQLLERTGMHSGVTLCQGNNIHITLETGSGRKSSLDNLDATVREILDQNLPHKGIAFSVRKLSHLPRERRHRSKILYNRLKCNH